MCMRANAHADAHTCACTKHHTRVGWSVFWFGNIPKWCEAYWCRRLGEQGNLCREQGLPSAGNLVYHSGLVLFPTFLRIFNYFKIKTSKSVWVGRDDVRLAKCWRSLKLTGSCRLIILRFCFFTYLKISLIKQERETFLKMHFVFGWRRGCPGGSVG